MATLHAKDPTRPNALSDKYTEDEYGKEECGFHRAQVMKREAKFDEAIPQAVSLIYDIAHLLLISYCGT